MAELFDHPLSQAGLLFAAVFVMTALFITVARRFRGSTVDDMQDSQQLISKFHDLHTRGGLSDEEFRTIETKLATELKSELNSNSNNG